MSIIQAKGLKAVFECLYLGAISSWVVNGIRQSDNNFPSDVVAVAGTPASLTIPAIQEYNNAIVQCRAFVEVGRELAMSVLSDNATLTVNG